MAQDAAPLSAKAAEDKDALREEVNQAIANEDWKKARAAAKKLKRALAREHRDEATKLLRTIDAREALEKIAKAWESRPRAKKALQDLDRFLMSVEGDEDLEKRGRELQKKIRDAVYFVIGDFESGIFNDWSSTREEKHVKQGEVAGHWNPEEDDAAVFLYSEQRDWTQYTHLVLWIYNADAKKGSKFTLDPYVVDRGTEDYFQYTVNVTWKGWKELRVPLHGKKSKFLPTGKPTWKNIGGLRFWTLRGRHLDLIIDDVRLEKRVAPGKGT